MKQEVPMPVIIGAIVVVVLIVVVIGYRALSSSKPPLVKGGVHVTPPNFAQPPSHSMNGGATAPQTGGQ